MVRNISGQLPVVLHIQPRTPCYKLGIKFGWGDGVEKFCSSGHSGFYFSVIAEGELGAVDMIERAAVGIGQVSIAEVFQLSGSHKPDSVRLERALQSPLPNRWKAHLTARFSPP